MDWKPTKASAFVASSCVVPRHCVFTGLFPCPFLWPLCIRSVMTLNVGNVENAKKVVASAVVVHLLPVKIHETGSDEINVQERCGGVFLNYFESPSHGLKCMETIALGKLFGETAGVATSGSMPDKVIYCLPAPDRAIGIGLIEEKNTACAPLEPMGQAFVEATILVFSQQQVGLPWDQCVVALMLCNGQLFQFGFVALLQPACPVLYVTSHVLDACDPADSTPIAMVSITCSCWIFFLTYVSKRIFNECSTSAPDKEAKLLHVLEHM